MSRAASGQGGSGDGVTAETYGTVMTHDPHEECWLLRLPPRLAEAFAAAPEGTVLGDLVFTKGGIDERTKRNIKPSFTVHVAEDLADIAAAAAANQKSNDDEDDNEKKNTTSKVSSNTLPLHYSLQSMTKKVPVLHPFVRHPTNGSMALWGTVSRTANVQVERDDVRYRAQLKDRLVATNITANRFVKPMENTESVMSRTAVVPAALQSSKSGPPANFGDAVYQFGKRRLEATQNATQTATAAAAASKKARQFAPDQSLRSVVFELFAQQAYWAVKDLKAAAVAGGATHAGSRKAESELRDILREIGEYHRSGDHKNMWELRKEYQQG